MRLKPQLLALALAAPLAAAQAPATPPAATAPAAAPAAVTASSILNPALEALTATVNGLKTDKWKRGSVRDEAGQDIGSILTDIQVHLPPLLSDADAAPALASRLVPVARNIDALYDVLLRVYDASRIAGPSDQVDSLQQSLSTLSRARLALYDQMEQSTGAQEQLAVQLRATVEKQSEQIASAAKPAPCPTPAAKKKKTAKPSAAKP